MCDNFSSFQSSLPPDTEHKYYYLIMMVIERSARPKGFTSIRSIQSSNPSHISLSSPQTRNPTEMVNLDSTC